MHFPIWTGAEYLLPSIVLEYIAWSVDPCLTNTAPTFSSNLINSLLAQTGSGFQVCVCKVSSNKVSSLKKEAKVPVRDICFSTRHIASPFLSAITQITFGINGGSMPSAGMIYYALSLDSRNASNISLRVIFLLKPGTSKGERREGDLDTIENISPLRRRMTTSSLLDSSRMSASFSRAFEYV